MKLGASLLLFLGTAWSGWASTILALVPTPVAVNPGDTFGLGVMLVTDTPLAGYQFDVVFPTFLQASSPISIGFFAANGCCFDPGTLDNGSGTISNINDFSFSATETGLDTLVVIPFTALDTGTGQITLQNVAFSDADGNGINVDSVGFADVNSTTAPAPAQAPEPATWTVMGGLILVIAGKLRRGRNSAAPVTSSSAMGKSRPRALE